MVVALSRCLGSLALLAASSQGLRMGRKNSVASEKDCFSAYDGMPLLRLKPCSTPEEVVAKLQAAGCTFITEEEEVLGEKCADAEIVCSKEAADRLASISSITAPDAGAFWRETSGVAKPFNESAVGIASDFYSQWRNYNARMARVESLVAASGGVAKMETVGQTLQGRDMKIVRMRGSGWAPGGPRVVVTFNIHAREWIAGMSGVYTVEELIKKVKASPSYLAGIEVVLMPMANPDGFIYSETSSRMHRKNMRDATSSCPGVDLNRNFDAKWGKGGSSGNKCADTYHGSRSMSEPESNVIAKVMNEAPMTSFIDVHAYSELIISSWGYTKDDHPRKAEYRNLGGSVQSAIKAVGGKTWTEGPIAQVLYQATGSTNDYADARGALGVCFELRPGRYGGGGFAPPENQILIGSQECYAGLLAVIDYSKSPPPTTPAPPGDCPWHGCLLGCGGENCQYCDRCK